LDKNSLILILIILGIAITEIIVRVLYYKVFKKDNKNNDDDMEDNMGAMG